LLFEVYQESHCLFTTGAAHIRWRL